MFNIKVSGHNKI